MSLRPKVVYVLFGASLVATALGYFAQSMIKKSKKWYEDTVIEETARKRGCCGHVIAWVNVNSFAVKMTTLWICFVASLIVFWMIKVNRLFSDALYFAVSSLSTGGLLALPNDSPSWYFGLVAVLAAVGVPVMGIAMGQIASLLIDFGDADAAKEAINAKVGVRWGEMG
jgi:hypothetical protein